MLAMELAPKQRFPHLAKGGQGGVGRGSSNRLHRERPPRGGQGSATTSIANGHEGVGRDQATHLGSVRRTRSLVFARPLLSVPLSDSDLVSWLPERWVIPQLGSIAEGGVHLFFEGAEMIGDHRIDNFLRYMHGRQEVG